jgi:hypothetical protein
MIPGLLNHKKGWKTPPGFRRATERWWGVGLGTGSHRTAALTKGVHCQEPTCGDRDTPF